MFKKIIIIFSLFIFLSVLLFAAAPLVYSQGILPEAGGKAMQACIDNAPEDVRLRSPKAIAAYCGNYEIDDFIFLAINVSKWILGIVGSLALLMFVYGGFLMITSGENIITEGGKSSKINKGKKVITAAIIGIVIVFSSYLIIKFVLETMGINWSGQKIIIPSTASQSATKANK